MRRTTLSVFALAAAGLSAPALAQETGTDAAGEIRASYCNTGFMALDTDGDGMLTEEEIEAGSRAIFEEIDADTDGAISREEFTACEERGLEAAQEAFSRTYGDMEAGSLDEAWATAAGNNPDIETQGMSREDFLGAAADAFEMRPTMTLEAEGAEPVAFGQPFVYLGEGESLDEMSTEEFAARSAYTFELTDADGDDYLSREEFIERGERLTPDIEAINDRFDRMDTNADDSLSQEEFTGMDRLRTDSGADMAEGVPVIYYFFYQRG
ncbi:EF-hand domain-containing protein [Histidinibacterium lentulum]|nr:EF-hand domain-containing protein [Histidinibacterium lentulum]